jgi:hypothetical protein
VLPTAASYPREILRASHGIPHPELYSTKYSHIYLEMSYEASMHIMFCFAFLWNAYQDGLTYKICKNRSKTRSSKKSKAIIQVLYRFWCGYHLNKNLLLVMHSDETNNITTPYKMQCYTPYCIACRIGIDLNYPALSSSYIVYCNRN